MPDVHQEFVDVTKQLEKHYKDMQDIEFTIENGNFIYYKHVTESVLLKQQ